MITTGKVLGAVFIVGVFGTAVVLAAVWSLAKWVDER